MCAVVTTDWSGFNHILERGGWGGRRRDFFRLDYLHRDHNQISRGAYPLNYLPRDFFSTGQCYYCKFKFGQSSAFSLLCNRPMRCHHFCLHLLLLPLSSLRPVLINCQVIWWSSFDHFARKSPGLFFIRTVMLQVRLCEVLVMWPKLIAESVYQTRSGH